MNRRTFLAAAIVASTLAATGQTTNSILAGYDVWPFDTKEATRRQTETSQAIKQPVVLETRIGKDGPAVNWHLIPSGRFMMGSPANERATKATSGSL